MWSLIVRLIISMRPFNFYFDNVNRFEVIRVKNLNLSKLQKLERDIPSDIWGLHGIIQLLTNFIEL